jgi:integrase/recombinase XerD
MAVGDLARLVAAAEARADAGKPRDLALLLFLVETGCRVGEAASLRLDWLDLEKGDGLVEGKTDRRAVDFTAVTTVAMRAWLAMRPATEHAFVWVGRYGKALSASGIYQVLRRLAREAGVKGRFNPHSIRHLVGQSWTDEVSLELARQKLGHSTVLTTAMFYSHQDRARVKAATQRLSLVNDGDV